MVAEVEVEVVAKVGDTVNARPKIRPKAMTILLVVVPLAARARVNLEVAMAERDLRVRDPSSR